MTDYVLDTNAITGILRNDAPLTTRSRQAITDGHNFLGCPIVYYEIKRGLIARDARKQMQAFEKLYDGFIWKTYTRASWQKAAELWAKRRSMGQPVADADLLIAVFALTHNAVLVTNNTKDFVGLNATLEDWST